MTLNNKPNLWRNDITGLRAIAVLPVVFFHAFPNILPGGFFGVDVFFVISGYLISGIIFRGLKAQTFSYLDFYDKRIKRIIPNLLLLFLFVSAIGFFTLIPMEFENLGKHLYSSSAFAQNFRLLHEFGYFSEDSIRKPLLHLWSLATEEQFYIFFPILCTLVWKLTKLSRVSIGTTVGVITVASLVFCLSLKDADFAFYFPLARFWELGAGILVAYAETFLDVRFAQYDQSLRNWLSVLGLGAVVLPMVWYSKSMTHPGYVTLLPVIGAVFILVGCPDAIINRTILSWRPITFIGLISYSLYLWHWPFLSYLYISNPQHPVSWTLLALLASLLVSIAVYFAVELPIRRCQIKPRAAVSLLLLIGLCLVFTFGQYVKKQEGLPHRPLPEGWQKLAEARPSIDFKEYKKAGKITYEGIDLRVTNKNSFPSIIFAGDSHAEQYYSRAYVMSQQYGVTVGFITTPGCFILSSTTPYRDDEDCIKNRRAFWKLIEDGKVQKIVIAQIWGNHASKDPAFPQALLNFRQELRKHPKISGYALLDAPWTSSEEVSYKHSFDPMKHANIFSFNEHDFIVPLPRETLWKEGNQWVRDTLGQSIQLLDPLPYVCPNGLCNLLRWYHDDDHLQPERVRSDAVWLDPIFTTSKSAQQ